MSRLVARRGGQTLRIAAFAAVAAFPPFPAFPAFPACAAFVAAVTLLTACATRQGSVVLLPDAADRPTAVQVTQGNSQVLLDRPYAAAELTSRGPRPFDSNAQAVTARYGAALAAQPVAPRGFTLYFLEDKDEFTAASLEVVDAVFNEIAKRPVPDVLVIGHADTVGSDAYNDALSRQRAEVVRSALIARGVAPDQVVAIGRGKREPEVRTANGVAEPLNRRVEIQVR